MAAIHEQLEALRAQLSKWNAFKEQPVWLELSQLVDAQLGNRERDSRRSQDFSIQAIVKREYARGECAGLELFKHIPDIETTRLQGEIEILVDKLSEMKEDDDYEAIPATNDPAP